MESATKLLTPEQQAILESAQLSGAERKKVRKCLGQLEMEKNWQKMVDEVKKTQDFHLSLYHPVSGTLPLYHPTEGIYCKACCINGSTTIRRCGHSFCSGCYSKLQQFAMEWKLPKVRCVCCPQVDAIAAILEKLLTIC